MPSRRDQITALNAARSATRFSEGLRVRLMQDEDKLHILGDLAVDRPGGDTDNAANTLGGLQSVNWDRATTEQRLVAQQYLSDIVEAIQEADQRSRPNYG